MRRTIGLLLWPLLAQSAFGQDIAPVGTVSIGTIDIKLKPTTVKLKCIVEPTIPMTRRIAILLDVSGSMAGESLAKAHGFIQTILNKPEDAYDVMLWAFSNQTWRWRQDWTQFPDEKAAKAADAWIWMQRTAGCTDPLGAIKAALEQDTKNLTVLMVSDGDFDDLSRAAAVYRTGQDDRKEKALLLFYLPGSILASPGVENAKQLAEEQGGGLWTDE